MQTFTTVRPEHLNYHGFLFGGQLLLWVDEFAWMAAARENPGRRLVTRAMDDIEFHRSAPAGSILRFEIREKRRGTTSVGYSVDVYCDAPGATEEYLIFSTIVTFVGVDAEGNKKALADS
jgi:acyl-CoA hydrolase